MKRTNTITVKSSFNVSFFSKSLWLLLSLVILNSGCSNNYNDEIQPSTTQEHAQLEDQMPIVSYQPDKEKQSSTKPSENIYKTPILIKAKRPQLNIRPSLTNKTLVLGDSRIEHWPLGLPICQQCNLEINRVLYPDGPSTLLVLKDGSTNYQWGILQSGQKQAYLLGAKLFFDEQGKLNIIPKKTETNKFMLQAGKSFNYKDCNITPLWIENIKPMSSDYSDDQAKHKIQIFFECQN